MSLIAASPPKTILIALATSDGLRRRSVPLRWSAVDHCERASAARKLPARRFRFPYLRPSRLLRFRHLPAGFGTHTPSFSLFRRGDVALPGVALTGVTLSAFAENRPQFGQL